MAVTPYHHGITALEPISGAVPITTTATAVIGLIAVADDADETVYPLNTPVLVTSITRGLAAAGYDGNLRRSLEAIQPITNPTVVVVRVANPFGSEVFDDSGVIGTTLPSGQRTGIQALLTAKSKLGVTPKILSAPDVETPDVIQALIGVAKKLRAITYVTPRDTNGVVLPTKESVAAYRDTLGAREVELIWPEWTSGNVLLGVENSCTPQGLVIPSVNLPMADYSIDYTVNGGLKNRWTFDSSELSSPTINSLDLFSHLLAGDQAISLPLDSRVVSGGGGVGAFQFYGNNIQAADSPDDSGLLSDVPTTIKFFAVAGQANDPIQSVFSTSTVTIHACGTQNWPGY
jgi:hypothetical protein